MRQRRLAYEQDMAYVRSVLQQGTAKANAVAQTTLQLAKDAMQQRYF
jgi:hypothetical protein